LKLDEEDTTQSQQKLEATSSQEDEQTEDDVKLTNEATPKEEVAASKEAEQRNVNLEKKLVQNDELDARGILDLSSMNVTDNDIPLIIQQIFRQEKKKCTSLVLRDNALTSVGVKILVDELLTAPTNLKSLSLSSNPGIEDTGVEHLVRLLQRSRSITVLALHNTGITNRGVRLLANVLCDIDSTSVSSLEKLYVSFNTSITDESLEAFVEILERNQTLKALSLQNCSLSDRARRRLRQVSTKKKKRKFSLSE
jgi:hypothetical protein